MVRLRSIALPNKQFWARDNLANERTYLAWLKTSLMFVSVGIALAQFDRFVENNSVISIAGFEIYLRKNEDLVKSGSPLGAVCLILGIFVLVTGTFRFYYTQAMLLKKKFPVANFSAVFLLFAAAVCIAFFLMSASKV